MPTKVLVVSNYRSYHTNRPEAAIFKGLAKRGLDIHIMTYGDSSFIPEFEEAGITVIPHHPESKKDPEAQERIRSYIQTQDIDVVHFFNRKASVNGIKACKGLDVKVVLYCGFTGHIKWYDPTMYNKFLSPRVDKIFCNSIGVKEAIDKQAFFDPSKTVVINKGHDISWYQDIEAVNIRKELEIPERSLLLVNVANNRRMKGIPYLMKAINLLPEGTDFHLVLAGRDLDKKGNLEIIQKGAHANRVHFLGFRKDVLNVVKAADMFVLPSTKRESITKSVLESMSLGTAPIVTDIAGNVELIDQGVQGIIIPKKNPTELSKAILRVINDRSLVNKFSVASQERIRTVLSSEQTIEKTAKLYEELAAERRGESI
jgi:glycosyltransferase involved in cell wall biosynthesis